MKVITAEDALNGTVVTREDRLQFIIETAVTSRYTRFDPVLVLGFEKFGFKDGMSIYKGSIEIDHHKSIVRFDRKND